jgi:hypothetical protein
MFNITYLPAGLISGVCVPTVCTQEIVNNFADSFTQKINNLVIKVAEKINKVPSGDGFI